MGRGTLVSATGYAMDLLSGSGSLCLCGRSHLGQRYVGCLKGGVPVIPDAQPLDAGLIALGVDDDLADFVGIRDGGLAIEDLSVLAPRGDGQRLGLVHPQSTLVRSGFVLFVSHGSLLLSALLGGGGLASAKPEVILPYNLLLVKGQKGSLCPDPFSKLRTPAIKSAPRCARIILPCHLRHPVPLSFIKVPSTQCVLSFLHDAFLDPDSDIELESELDIGLNWLVIETWDKVLYLVREEWRGAWCVVVSEGGVV